MRPNNFYISAYATSPSPRQWSSELEREFFVELAKNPQIIGIEQPLYLESNRYPLSWLQDNIPNHWNIVVTTLPVFMNLSKADPLLGLASKHEKYRSDAVRVIENINQQVQELNRMFSRKIVSAIHLHSLPSNKDEIRGNSAALLKSLQEIKNMDWNGAQLNLEHCDAQLPEQTADKGFLLLADELEVLDQVTGFGIALNWARSAIECRSVNGPIKHIQMAKQAGLLRGFFFSGCIDHSESDYGLWKDTHMPIQNFIESNYLPKESLLGAQEIQQTMSLLDDSIYLGIKVSNLKIKKDVETSIGLNIDSMRAIQHHWKE